MCSPSKSPSSCFSWRVVPKQEKRIRIYNGVQKGLGNRRDGQHMCQHMLRQKSLPSFNSLWEPSFPALLNTHRSFPTLSFKYVHPLYLLIACLGPGILFQLPSLSYFVVQSLSCVRFLATPRTTAGQASLSFTISWSLLKHISIELVMPSNHFILFHPFSSCPQPFPSSGSFYSESTLHIKWPKYWNFSFSFSPSNEYSVLISFRMDWFYLFAIQRLLL